MRPPPGTETAALVALVRRRAEPGWWAQVTASVLETGSALALLAHGEGLAQARDDLADWAARGLQLVTVLDADYPVQLLGIHQAPPVLFFDGALLAADPAVAVVGSRRASRRGIALSAAVATNLVESGFSVVAALAAGISTAAHRAAAAAGGRSVAVLAGGIGTAPLAASPELHSEIAATGLVLSPTWPDHPPSPAGARSGRATVSGYSLASIVVEAAERDGTRALVRQAIGHGRPVVLAAEVVERNAWAQALLATPGVHVGDGPAELAAVVATIVGERSLVEDRLRLIVG